MHFGTLLSSALRGTKSSLGEEYELSDISRREPSALDARLPLVFDGNVAAVMPALALSATEKDKGRLRPAPR